MATAIGTYATPAGVKARLGITNSTDDALIGTLCDQVNAYIEGPAGVGRILAPVDSATYLFHGDGTRRIWVRDGVRAVSLLRIAQQTGGTFNAVDAGDYFLLPYAHQRQPGMPATRIELSNVPSSGGWTYLPLGYANVEVTMTTGPDAIPDDIVDVALTTVVRAWNGRQAGQADMVGTTETGMPLVSRYLSARDRDTLRAYRWVTMSGG